MTVLIKRYANRKLYNTQTSRYITLKGIAALIDADQDVRVIDNETGEDITSVALSQILVDNERTNRTVPGSLLSDLIHRGGARGRGEAPPRSRRRPRRRDALTTRRPDAVGARGRLQLIDQTDSRSRRAASTSAPTRDRSCSLSSATSRSSSAAAAS